MGDFDVDAPLGVGSSPPHPMARCDRLSRCRCFDPAAVRPLWACHTAHADPATRSGLLGPADRVCAAFWHARACRELDEPGLCVGWHDPGYKCPTNVAVLVARLQSAGGAERLVARYTNCFRGGGSEGTQHAESFVMADRALAAQLRRGDALTLHITYQPCHHSGGKMSYDAKHPTSCTEALLRWRRDVLAPAGVELRVRCSDIYRAAWTDTTGYPPAHVARFEARCERAREGLRALKRVIDVDGFGPAEWDFVWSLTTCRDEFSAEDRAHRARFDARVRRFIREV